MVCFAPLLRRAVEAKAMEHKPERQKSLAGAVVLITGAARRVGAAMVRELHGAGARIAFTYRSSGAEADALAARLQKQRPDSALALPADVLDTDALPALIEQVLGNFGRLDALINNASSFYPTPLGEITERDWADLIGTNLKAPLFLTQAAAPELRKRRGAVINMVDIHAQRPLGRHLVYCAAKAGLAMLTRGLARELGPEVRVNGIAPGPILWPDAGMDEKQKQNIIRRTALQRAGTPEDVAALALYLLRDAPYVTGQIIAVDGGRSAGW